MLPILAYRNQIIDAVHTHARCIVSAPPGTGKSTQIPKFFADACSPNKRLFVLEPRRIAARTLAFRVAEELGETCGGSIGYQVRFEGKISAETKILFLTYGTFLQMLAADPMAVSASTIIFDEFHERSFDADVALAWTLRLSDTVREDLKVMVLSATLDMGPLQHFLHGAVTIEVPDQAFPVDVSYQPPKPQERIADQVERSLARLMEEMEGSVLVFLPGVYEIERTAERVYDRCKRTGVRLLRLHGRMDLEDQQAVLRLPGNERCVILSTNVAETSLTIPGVTAVIDSGLARIASYDVDRGCNTLYLGRITQQNAKQRAGRAGRLARGIGIRLWGREDEAAMTPAIVPEALRLDPAKHLLSLSYLQMMLAGDKVCGNRFRFPATIPLLTPPPADRWSSARDELVRCGAMLFTDVRSEAAAGKELPLFPLTKLGKTMSRLPLEPAVAAVVLRSRSHEERHLATAMAALWESGTMRAGESHDLFDRAQAFLSDRRDPEWGRQVAETSAQLERILGETEAAGGMAVSPVNSDIRRQVTEAWMQVFSHRIGARQGRGSVYKMIGGQTARIVPVKRVGGSGNDLPELICALVVHEQAGRDQARNVTIPLYLPIEPGWLTESFTDEIRRAAECRWDEERRRVVVEELRTFRGLPISRQEVSNAAGEHRERITACLAAELVKSAWNWQADDPKAALFACRVRRVAAAYPEMNIPALTPDDWELIFHELCEGKVSLDEVKRCSMTQAIKSYLGPHLSRFVETKAPEMVMLPSGRKGRITYFDEAPPELSARLGDLIGYRDRFLLMDGRVQGVFDILAPNHRTVQKTSDLGSFWKNTYPSIKRELRRKYPKHPWP